MTIADCITKLVYSKHKNRQDHDTNKNTVDEQNNVLTNLDDNE